MHAYEIKQAIHRLNHYAMDPVVLDDAGGPDVRTAGASHSRPRTPNRRASGATAARGAYKLSVRGPAQSRWAPPAPRSRERPAQGCAGATKSYWPGVEGSTPKQ
jgi:hypothetical protein